MASVVVQHRMVLSLSERQTTLWDQLYYAGDPSLFLWVLPIASVEGVKVGVADNAFVDALEVMTAPTVQAFFTACPGALRGGADAGLGDASASSCPGSLTVQRLGPNGGPVGRACGTRDVLVTHAQSSIVGPYQLQLVHAAADGTLDRWLQEHGLSVPDSVSEAVRFYSERSFDFVVAWVRPEAAGQQMPPIRVTFPGYAPTLPLRMVAAGATDALSMELLVLAPWRARLANAPVGAVEQRSLRFDVTAGRSNYPQLFDDALRTAGPRSWVLESALAVRLSGAGVGSLVDPSDPVRVIPYRPPPVGDSVDTPPDAGSAPATDDVVAFDGLPETAHLTRLRTRLPLTELDDTLTVEPDDTVAQLVPESVAPALTNIPSCVGAGAGAFALSPGFGARPGCQCRAPRGASGRGRAAGLGGLFVAFLAGGRLRRRGRSPSA